VLDRLVFWTHGVMRQGWVRLQSKLSKYANPTTADEIARRLNELGFDFNTVLPSSLN